MTENYYVEGEGDDSDGPVRPWELGELYQNCIQTFLHHIHPLGRELVAYGKSESAKYAPIDRDTTVIMSS